VMVLIVAALEGPVLLARDDLLERDVQDPIGRAVGARRVAVVM
jgi:hypothetical protein